MANIAFDNFQQYTHGGAASSSDSFTVGSGSNTLVVVGITTTDARTISAITCGGATMTLIQSSSNFQASGLDIFFYYKLGVSTGANTIAITLSSAAATFYVNVASYFNVVQVAPDQIPTPTSNINNTTLTLSLTSTHQNEWIIGLAFTGSGLLSVTNGISRSTGAGQSNFAIIDSSGLITPAGTYSLSTVQSANNTYAVLILSSFISPVNISLSETAPTTENLTMIKKRFITLSETQGTSDAVSTLANRWKGETPHTGTWNTENKSI